MLLGPLLLFLIMTPIGLWQLQEGNLGHGLFNTAIGLICLLVVIEEAG